MNPVDLFVLAAATTSITRLMTHDTITAGIRARIFAAGAERSRFDPVRPSGRNWSAVEDATGTTIGWYRPPSWYVRMLRCPRFCAPMWAAAVTAGLWTLDRGPARVVVLTAALRGIHSIVYRWTHDQFEGP